jgi:Protein of unknown function (DUF1344)
MAIAGATSAALRFPRCSGSRNQKAQRTMRRITMVWLSALSTLSPTLAHAADDSGIIKAIDGPDRTVTLSDDKTYVLPPSFDITNLHIGDRVTVTFSTDSSGRNNVSSITSSGIGVGSG